MTQQQISAIQEQARLHAIASEKMQIRDRLEERYREVFAKGFEKLSTASNVLELLPDCDTDADRLKALIDCTQDGTAPFHDITAAMKTIPEFAECEKLNVEVGKAYYEFFCANDALNRPTEVFYLRRRTVKECANWLTMVSFCIFLKRRICHCWKKNALRIISWNRFLAQNT